jgi:hypothetical protein
MSDQPLGPNPFVGPRPFRLGESLFGRGKEVPDLFYLLNAERVVLLHSPSGAGKSSLIHAGLLPRLKQEEFDVWPTIRVSTEPPADSGVNRYVLSTVLSLEEELPEKLRRGADVLSSLSLEEYVAGRPRRKGAPPSIVLIFDQFEEILTVDPLAIDAKKEFFTELGGVLRNREVWALFAIREDYLAPLDPYAPLVPTQLTNRFRLDLLALDAAAEAIQRPVLLAGREFAPGVAQQLIQDLASVSVQRPDGSFVKESGHTVEPVQLQVVCRRLWEEMPATDRVVDSEDLRLFGDVTQALGAYYDLSVAQVAAGDANRERQIREWFSDKLITRGEIRGQVLQGAEKTEDLDNRIIYKLLDTHLIRAEKRRGATWYELAHDRLIAPVSGSNNQWFETHLEEFQRKASVWEKSGHPDGLLLSGEALKKAQAWVAQTGAILTNAEDRYLKASQRNQEVVEAQMRQAKRIRRLAVASVVAGVIAVGVAAFALREWQSTRALVGELKEAAIAEQRKDEEKARAETLASNAQSGEHVAQERTQRAIQEVVAQRKARDAIFVDLLTKVIRLGITIPKGSVPGEVKALEGNWITLVAANDKDKTPFVIVRSYAESGQGRVMAVGHNALLIYHDQNGDNPMLGTALQWLRGDKPEKVLLAKGGRQVMQPNELNDLSNKIRSWQFDVEQIDEFSDYAKLASAGVIVIGNQWGGFRADEINAIEQFVRNGGGVLAAGLGWSWKQPNPGAPIRAMDQYAMNQLLSRFGATWTEKVIYQ